MEESIALELKESNNVNHILNTQKDMYLKYKEVNTNYGILTGISSIDWYENGNIKECQADEEIVLNTPAGKLIPGYSYEGVRNKYIKSLAFYENGNIKKIALNEQTFVDTLSGTFPAELVTFYESGNVKRVFPLNGKITGYWTEENEFELAVPIQIKLSFAEFERKIISIHFYESGMFKSITFWPKELLSFRYANVVYGVRYGISFYAAGNIRTLEPAYPMRVKTPIGEITAFDVNAIGINGDVNSLQFDEDGSVRSLVSSTDIFSVTDKTTDSENKKYIIKPGLRQSMSHEEAMDIISVYIEFKDRKVIFKSEEYYEFDISYWDIKISNNAFLPVSKCSSCAGCNGCI